jgi:lactoylglutathione lyase
MEPTFPARWPRIGWAPGRARPHVLPHHRSGGLCPLLRDARLREAARAAYPRKAVNYFLGIPGQDGPELELTYNFETPEGGYELGTGYGHIAVTVDDLDAALADLADERIEPERPPYSVREGGSRICFVRDPDGYRVELVEQPSA